MYQRDFRYKNFLARFHVNLLQETRRNNRKTVGQAKNVSRKIATGLWPTRAPGRLYLRPVSYILYSRLTAVAAWRKTHAICINRRYFSKQRADYNAEEKNTRHIYLHSLCQRRLRSLAGRVGWGIVLVREVWNDGGLTEGCGRATLVEERETTPEKIESWMVLKERTGWWNTWGEVSQEGWREKETERERENELENGGRPTLYVLEQQ